MDAAATIAEVTQLLNRASEAWQAQTNEGARAAMDACEQALRLLDPLDASASHNRLRAAAWMQRGQILDTAGQPAEAVRCYDQAINVLPADDPEDSPGLAAVWMNRGNALQRIGSPESLAAAAASFNEVVRRLEAWPEPRPDEIENTLGAAYMNTGICQARLAAAKPDEETVTRARKGFDQAIGLLMRAAEKNPVARRNLASAWGNRGVLMLQTAQWDEARRSFGEALALLEALRAEGGPAILLEIASMHLNRAQAEASSNAPDEALAAVRAALALTGPEEARQPHFCNLGLRARHSLCILLAGRITVGAARSPEVAALVAEAGDVVEEGLALAKGWGDNAAWFADPSLRLFEFGGWLYRTQQPQFLAEFFEEHLADDPRRAAVAGQALHEAREGLRRRSFAALGPDEVEWMESWTALAAKVGELAASARAPAGVSKNS